MRKVILGLLVFSLCFAGKAFADYTITQIASGNYEDPTMNDNGHIVWSGGSNIYLYDGSTITTIGVGGNPHINNNDDIVWHSGGGIFLYDGSTTTQIGNGSSPRINDSGEVVWHNVTSAEIFFYDGFTTTKIGSGFSPKINNNSDILWYSGGVIFLYDGLATTQITNSPSNVFFPDINESKNIVWMGNYAGGKIGEIFLFLYDGSSITRIADLSQGGYFPIINNDGYIVWHGSGVYLYDGSTISQIGSGNFPDINNNGDIVWAASEGIFLATVVPHTPNDPPIADAGADIFAVAGEMVTLDSSFSYDPDGSIISYKWIIISDPDNPVISQEETFEMIAHGYAEEMIQLTVIDNRGGLATDTMMIINPGIEGPQGPQGEQGIQGPPGMTPEEVAAIQAEIAFLKKQSADNRYLLEQLPQLQKKIAELEAQVQ